jgi:hypothetical protein
MLVKLYSFVVKYSVQMNIGWSKILSSYYLAKQGFAAFIFTLTSALYFKIYLAGIFLANLLTWILAAIIKQQAKENTLILHYNVDFGIDYIADAWYVFLLPLSGLVINLINLILVRVLYKYRQEKLIFHLLFAGAEIANLTILVALAMLYLINFR